MTQSPSFGTQYNVVFADIFGVLFNTTTLLDSRRKLFYKSGVHERQHVWGQMQVLVFNASFDMLSPANRMPSGHNAW